MTFWSERLKVALFSHHRPLREAVAAVRKDALLVFFRSLHRGLARVPGGPYRLLVAGLNPHAGEDGGLGGRKRKRSARRGSGGGGRHPVSGPFLPTSFS